MTDRTVSDLATVTEAEAERVRSVLDAASDAVLMFERDTLRFTYVNQGAIVQLGYSRDELLSMGPLHIKPMFSEAEFRTLIEGVPAGQSHSYRTLHRRKDGSDIPVDVVLQYPANDLGSDSPWMASIARDLTLRLEMDERIRSAERDLALLEDRERIARDMHDRVIQRLFAAGLGIEGIRKRVGDPVVSEQMERVVGELDETIRELRSAIFQLTLSSATDSRRAMILSICNAERAALGFDPRLRFDGPIETISDASGDHLLAVLREALSNVAHHARASTVRVTIAVAGDLVLWVEDDGIGLLAETRQGPGNGMANMAARAAKLGGSCEVTAASPSGTVLEWRVPQV